MRATTIRWALLIAAGLLGGVACGSPEECPEPCLEHQYCSYGACVPYNDVGTEDAPGEGDVRADTAAGG
jgi:hypothetical protein